MKEKKIETRGISRKEIVTYLNQLGATTVDHTLFMGNNWTCHVFEEDYFHMFQSLIPKVNVQFNSEEEEVLVETVRMFRKKIFRAGG